MTTLTLPEAFSRVRGYLDEQQNLQAIGLCEHILEQHPTNLEALRLLGEAHLAQRNFERAAAAFEQVVRADPENIPARVGLGIAYEREGRLDAAMSEFEQALEVRPDMPELRTQLLRLYTDVWGNEGATLRLSRIGLARLYAKGHMLPQAVQEYRSYINEHPQRYDAWLGLLEVLWRDRQYDQAIDTARRILTERPEVLKANLILGHLLMARGDERGRNYWLVAQRADPFYEVAQQLFDPLPTDIPSIDTGIRTWDEQAAMARLTAAATEPVLDDWFPQAEDEDWFLNALESLPPADADAGGDDDDNQPATPGDLTLLSALLHGAQAGGLYPAAEPATEEPAAATGQTGRLDSADLDGLLSVDTPLPADAVLSQLEALWQQEHAAESPAEDDDPDAAADHEPAPAATDDSLFADIENMWAGVAGGTEDVERLAADLRAVLDDDTPLTLQQPQSDSADNELEPYQIEYVHTDHLPPLVSPTAALLPPADYRELPPLETAEVPPIAYLDPSPAAADLTVAADSPATARSDEAEPTAADPSAVAADDAEPAAAEPPAVAADGHDGRSVVERVLEIAENLTEGGSSSTAARAIELVERAADALQPDAATLGAADEPATVRLTPPAEAADVGLVPLEMDWLLDELNEPSALESAEVHDPLLAELLELAQHHGHLDLADIISGVDRYQGDAARIDQLGWSLYSLGVEIRHGGEVVELSDDELPVGAETAAAPQAERTETAAAPQAERDDVLLSSPGAPQASAVSADVPSAAAVPFPALTATVTPAAVIDAAPAARPLATVLVPAGRSQLHDFIPSGDAALDRMLEQLTAAPDNHTLALAIARFCAQTGRRELMNLLFRRPLRRPELIDQISEELEDLISFVDDAAILRALHRLLGDVRTRQGRAQEAVAAYGATFGVEMS
jgi:tetratricopeptide (TPR) repeat protein